jgi:two-component system cell cycle response regulator
VSGAHRVTSGGVVPDRWASPRGEPIRRTRGIARVMKIVIAEDDAVSRLVLRRALEDLNFEVVAFADGAEAWEYLRTNEARVVITDWMMPGLDGLDLCRRIRVRGALGPYVYLILLTSRSSREDRLKSLQAGADDILSKPLDRAELFARLNVARRIIEMEEQLRSRSLELERMHAELERRNVLLAELASCDGLTGLKNHRSFREALDAQFSLARWRGAPLSMVMLDVDQFKSFNDTFGHPAGDEVLREVARLLRSCVRDRDVVARYGGEEFAVLLPSTDIDDSWALAERLRQSIEQHPWELRPITISLGISTTSPRASRAALLIELADRSLYQSKAEGRNRVTHARDLPPFPADRRSMLTFVDEAGHHSQGEALPFIA